MSRNKPARQITVKLNSDEVASIDFFHRIENRDRELYPTILDAGSLCQRRQGLPGPDTDGSAADRIESA